MRQTIILSLVTLVALFLSVLSAASTQAELPRNAIATYSAK